VCDPGCKGLDLDRERWDVDPQEERFVCFDGGGVRFSGGLGDTVPQKESNFWRNVDVGIVGCGRWRIDACVTNPRLAKRLKSCRDRASATEFSSVGIHRVTRSILNRAATRRRACRTGVRDSQAERLLTAATAVVLSQSMTRRPLAKCSNHSSRA
jgi:hypothetical protein